MCLNKSGLENVRKLFFVGAEFVAGVQLVTEVELVAEVQLVTEVEFLAFLVSFLIACFFKQLEILKRKERTIALLVLSTTCFICFNIFPIEYMLKSYY